MALTRVLLLINSQNVRIIQRWWSLGRIHVYQESQAIRALRDAINFLIDSTTSISDADKIEYVNWPFQVPRPTRISSWPLWEDLQGVPPEFKQISDVIDRKIEENNVPARVLLLAEIVRSVVPWCLLCKRMRSEELDKSKLSSALSIKLTVFEQT